VMTNDADEGLQLKSTFATASGYPVCTEAHPSPAKARLVRRGAGAFHFERARQTGAGEAEIRL